MTSMSLGRREIQDSAQNRLARFRLLFVAAAIACGFGGCSWIQSFVNRPDVEAQRLSDAARDAENRGEMERAERLWTKAEKSNPTDAEVHREFARFLLTQNEFDDAERHLQQAAELDPEDAQTHVELARLLFDRNQHRPAEEALVNALDLDPTHPEALMMLAALAESRDQTDLALETYLRVLCCDEKNHDARMRIAALQLKSSKPERATPLLRSICSDPRADLAQQSRAQWALGIAYGRAQRWKDAASALSRAIENRLVMSADDWYLLAYAHWKAGDADSAQKVLATALQMQPDHSQARAMAQAKRWNPLWDRDVRTASIPVPSVWQ